MLVAYLYSRDGFHTIQGSFNKLKHEVYPNGTLWYHLQKPSLSRLFSGESFWNACTFEWALERREWGHNCDCNMHIRSPILKVWTMHNIKRILRLLANPNVMDDDTYINLILNAFSVKPGGGRRRGSQCRTLHVCCLRFTISYFYRSCTRHNDNRLPPGRRLGAVPT